MNLIDILILTLLVVFLVKGLMQGLVRELCALAGLLAGAFLAFRYQGVLAAEAERSIHLSATVAAAIAFLAIFLTTVLLFLLLGHLLSRTVTLLFLGGLNRVAGGLFGVAQAVVLLAVILYGLSLRSSPAFLVTSLRSSQLAPPYVRLGEAVYRGSSRILPVAEAAGPASRPAAR